MINVMAQYLELKNEKAIKMRTDVTNLIVEIQTYNPITGKPNEAESLSIPFADLKKAKEEGQESLDNAVLFVENLNALMKDVQKILSAQMDGANVPKKGPGKKAKAKAKSKLKSIKKK